MKLYAVNNFGSLRNGEYYSNVELFTDKEYARKRAKELAENLIAEGYELKKDKDNHKVLMNDDMEWEEIQIVEVEPNATLKQKSKYKITIPLSYQAMVCEELALYFDDEERAKKIFEKLKNDELVADDVYEEGVIEDQTICEDLFTRTYVDTENIQLVNLNEKEA